MLETLLQRWQLTTPRERRIVIAGAVLLAVVVVWLLLFDPARAGRHRVRAELPVMRAQLAQIEQLADEARRLGAVPAGNDSVSAVKVQLERSIEGAGLKPALAQLTHTGGLFDLRFKSVPFAAWLVWLESASRETRLRVVDAAVTRETGVGRVSVRLALEMPRRDDRREGR